MMLLKSNQIVKSKVYSLCESPFALFETGIGVQVAAPHVNLISEWRKRESTVVCHTPVFLVVIAVRLKGIMVGHVPCRIAVDVDWRLGKSSGAVTFPVVTLNWNRV